MVWLTAPLARGTITGAVGTAMEALKQVNRTRTNVSMVATEEVGHEENSNLPFSAAHLEHGDEASFMNGAFLIIL